MTYARDARDSDEPAPTVNAPGEEKPATPAKMSFRASRAPTSGYENVTLTDAVPLLAGSSSTSSTRSCGRWTGSHRSVSPLIRLKIAVLAPMPRASVMIAAAVNVRLRANIRSA